MKRKKAERNETKRNERVEDEKTNKPQTKRTKGPPKRKVVGVASNYSLRLTPRKCVSTPELVYSIVINGAFRVSPQYYTDKAHGLRGMHTRRHLYHLLTKFLTESLGLA